MKCTNDNATITKYSQRIKIEVNRQNASRLRLKENLAHVASVATRLSETEEDILPDDAEMLSRMTLEILRQTQQCWTQARFIEKLIRIN